MAPANLTWQPTASTLAAEAGVEQLWKLQLRKENAAILEELQRCGKNLEEFAADDKRKFQEIEERIAGLESRASELEAELKKDRQAREKYLQDIAALKARIYAPLESHLTNEQRAEINAIVAKKAPIIDSTSTDTITVDPGPAKALGPLAVSAVPRPISSTRTFMSTAKPRKSKTINPPTTNPSAPTAPLITKPRSSKRLEVQQSPLLRKSLKFSQGSSSVEDYVAKAAAAAKSIQKSGEVEFIARFIKGLEDAQSRVALLNQLQQSHPSRTKRDGHVEVMCDWADVEQALRAAGIIQASSQDPPPKKKKKVLIPSIWSESYADHK